MIDKNSLIYIAGIKGMVGSSIARRLNARGYNNVIGPGRSDLDLLDSAAVKSWFMDHKPDYVFLAAAKVGGIQANNTQRAEFLYENIMMEANIVHAAHLADVQRLLFLGSSCIYPRDCAQPIKEEYLLTGILEKTNEPYAVAKIAGIKLAEAYNAQYSRNYISVMPTNLFGPNDNYDLQTSHVLPALIRKAHEAKMSGAESITVWGTGTPKREFLYVDDLADACIHLMEESYNGYLVNIGTGEDISIAELVTIVMDVVGYRGRIVYDATKPDGTPRKLLDVSKMQKLGWSAQTSLRDGIAKAYRAAPFFNKQERV